jgi:predicted DCC family thiol-disulfide oxidoreductase YuxK
MKKPTLLYDGDCEFCQYCVDYLEKITNKQVHFIPYQDTTLGLKPEDCARTIHLVENNKPPYQGAAAGFKTLSYGASNRGWWLYKNVPGFAWMTEKMYLWVTHHRRLCHRLAKIICGNPWQPWRITFIVWFILSITLAALLVGQNS